MNVRGRRSARQPMTIHHPIRSRIESLAASQAEDHRAQLIFVLQDAVESGASVGFLPPLSTSDASAYWDGVAETVRGGSRVLLVARAPDGRRIVGTAQLMVLREARREGIGRALMAGWTPTPSTTGSWTRASDVTRATRGPASLRLSFRDAWRVT